MAFTKVKILVELSLVGEKIEGRKRDNNSYQLHLLSHYSIKDHLSLP